MNIFNRQYLKFKLKMDIIQLRFVYIHDADRFSLIQYHIKMGICIEINNLS